VKCMTRLFFVLIAPLMFLGCGGGGDSTTTPPASSQTGENWSIVSSLPLYSTPTSLVLSNKIAYIANYDLSIVDISNPASPVVTHTMTADTGTLGTIYSVSASNDRILVAAAPPCSGWCAANPFAGVLELYDTTNPSNPIKLSGISMAAGDAYLDGNIAYVSRNNLQPQLHVIDMSAQPTANILGSADIATAGRLAKAGNDVYLSYNNSSSFEALQTIDVTTPTNPTVLNAGNNAWSGVAHARIALSGNTAYIADGTQGLRVLDLSNPVSPSTILTIPAQSNVSDIAVYDSYLYVADGAGVRVFDISNPRNPVFLRTITTAYTAILVAVGDGVGAVVMEKTYHGLYYVGVFVPAAH